MAFVDRVVEHPNRWTLTNVDDATDVKTYDVVRDEGTVTNEGTPLNAENLNGEIDNVVENAMTPLTIDDNNNVRVRNVQCGIAQVVVPAANTTYTKTVTFPQAFDSVPNVVATPLTGVPQKVDLGVLDRTTTGFSIALQRDNATNTSVCWIAMI